MMDAKTWIEIKDTVIRLSEIYAFRKKDWTSIEVLFKTRQSLAFYYASSEERDAAYKDIKSRINI